MQVYNLYQNMLKQPHLLIAGATGSGKSVIVNALIYHGLMQTNEDFNMILIDPKRVELIAYKDLPHTLGYASEPQDMIRMLQGAMNICEKRYRTMQAQRVKKYNGSDIYVIIDELADLMTTNRKQVQPLIQRLCQVGRAAKIHVIACTQCPIAKVIPTEIKVNFDSRLGLRTRSAQDSRNILGFKGCEELPRYGQGYYMTPEGMQRYNLPMIPDSDVNYVINHWTTLFEEYKKKKRKKFLGLF